MKKIYSLLFFASLIFANNNVLKEAQELEKQGKYKEANALYKKLLQKDSITNKQVTFFKENIDKSKDKETNLSMQQMLTSSFDIYPYKANYFLPFSYDLKDKNDRENAEAKFQISFKKPISYDFFSLNESINLAYTQTSFWQIYKDSSPFRETNYKPEIYALFPYKNLDHTALKAYKLSLMHESNGQGGNKSRSWNKLYLEGFFQVDNIFIMPQLWYRIPDSKDDNPDLYKYYGYGELNLAYVYKQNLLKVKLRNNFNFSKENKGLVQIDYSFAFRKNAFAYVQLSSGYGESLIDYDKEINRISFGISLSR